MSDENEYLDLITSEFRLQPKFTAMVEVDVGVPVQIQNLFLSMIALFDIDVAVGNQLDILGQWIGVSRNVAIPIEGVYFSWDGTDPFVGWDFGNWRPADAPTTITSLPDEAYRTLLKAKIAANQWDGTTDGAYAIWDTIFTDITILIKDNQDMTYDLGIIGAIIDSLTVALVTGGYIPLKPEGVRVAQYFFSIDDSPIFAWDSDTDLLQGWETGAWVREESPT